MKRGLTRELIGMRVAHDLKEGQYVNLGMGLPICVSNFVPEGREVVFETENGVLGFGVAREEREWDGDRISAVGEQIDLLPGSSVFDSPTSFIMLRGGHIDITILGAYQVSEKGDLANWMRHGQKIGGMGGAMDLASGAKQVWVMMEHTTSEGAPRILKNCSYPLTARGVVNMVFTDLAVIEVTSDGLLLKEVAPGITPEEVQSVTEPKLLVSRNIKEIHL